MEEVIEVLRFLSELLTLLAAIIAARRSGRAERQVKRMNDGAVILPKSAVESGKIVIAPTVPSQQAAPPLP